MKRIANLIRANLNIRVFLPLLALALATTWYGLSPSLARFAEITGGQRFVDMQPALTAAALIEQARGYSPEAVRYYLGWSLFDYAWPFVTFTTMLFMTAWLFRFLPERRQVAFPLLVTAAYTTVLMDWGENLGFVAVLMTEPPLQAWLAWLAVLLHRGKLLFNLVFNAGFLVVLVATVATWVRRAGARTPG